MWNNKCRCDVEGIEGRGGMTRRRENKNRKKRSWSGREEKEGMKAVRKAHPKRIN